MSSCDPRVITVALEDILQEADLWSVAASQTLAVSYQRQRHVRENSERTFYRASVVFDGAQQDRESVTKTLMLAETQVNHAEVAKHEAHTTLKQALEELSEAVSVLEFWEDQLQEALAWLARAEARLARAIEEYERAYAAFDYAKRELERAQSRYHACLNDKNRSNCNSEASAVQSASEEVERALYRLQIAEAEVNDARAEVAAARARVQCCSQAVQYATEGVNIARVAKSEADDAVNAAERSLDFARAAQDDALRAEEDVAIELRVAEQMLHASRNALSQTEEAWTQLMAADDAEEAAQRYVRRADHEIQYRLQSLREFNRPDLQT